MAIYRKRYAPRGSGTLSSIHYRSAASLRRPLPVSLCYLDVPKASHSGRGGLRSKTERAVWADNRAKRCPRVHSRERERRLLCSSIHEPLLRVCDPPKKHPISDLSNFTAFFRPIFSLSCTKTYSLSAPFLEGYFTYFVSALWYNGIKKKRASRNWPARKVLR